MTFYKPFFNNVPPFNFNHAFRPSENIYEPDYETQLDNPSLTSENEKKTISQIKNNRNKSLKLNSFYDYLKETDNIIILALLFFLYIQKSPSKPLMLCLLLLLFED